MSATCVRCHHDAHTGHDCPVCQFYYDARSVGGPCKADAPVCRCGHEQPRHVPGWNICCDCGCEGFIPPQSSVREAGCETDTIVIRCGNGGGVA